MSHSCKLANSHLSEKIFYSINNTVIEEKLNGAQNHTFIFTAFIIHLLVSFLLFFLSFYFQNCKFWIQSSVEEEAADDFPILVTPWLAAIKQQEQIWLETCPNPHFPVSTKGKKVRCAADINMSNLGNLNIKHMSKIIKCTSTCLIEMSFIRGAPAHFNVHGLVL